MKLTEPSNGFLEVDAILPKVQYCSAKCEDGVSRPQH